MNLLDQNLKKVSVSTKITPIIVVKNDKIEDDILCKKSFDFFVTSNVEVHVDMSELEKKDG